MVRNIKRIAKTLGARVVCKVPDTKGGAFGAARLAAVLRDRLQPQVGARPGRPSDASWAHRTKVPMSDQTLSQLQKLAREMSTSERKVSPAHVAAQILEIGIRDFTSRNSKRDVASS